MTELTSSAFRKPSRAEAIDKRLGRAGDSATRNISQMRLARRGESTWEIRRVAEREGVDAAFVREEVAAGVFEG